MTQYHKALGVCLVTMFGLWGCSRGPATSNANNDKIKALETKTAKLDEELKAARQKLADAEEMHARLQQDIDRLTQLKKEREAQLKTRTEERDQVQTKYESFLRDLKDLAGRAESALHDKPAVTGVAARK
jgi:chromosome segregation ATPase